MRLRSTLPAELRAGMATTSQATLLVFKEFTNEDLKLSTNSAFRRDLASR
jgi:hypothetical protein